MALYARLWTDILDDPKLLRAARKGLKNLDKLPWLIAFAKRADADGRLEISGEKADPADIARSIPNVTERQIRSAIDGLLSLGILVQDADGCPRFAAWEFRNAGKTSDSREAIAERVRKHRDRKRATRNANVTGGNALQALRGNEQESREKRVERREKRHTAGSSEKVSLPPAAIEFGRTFYASAPLKRRRDVTSQLAATLNGGATLRRGVKVAAGSVERLEAACRAVIREGVEDPDKAIVVLLAKLGDLSREPETRQASSPTEKAATAVRQEEHVDNRVGAERMSLAIAWLDAQPDIKADVERELDREISPDAMLPIRTVYRNTIIARRWRDAGEPIVEPAETS